MYLYPLPLHLAVNLFLVLYTCIFHWLLPISKACYFLQHMQMRGPSLLFGSYNINHGPACFFIFFCIDLIYNIVDLVLINRINFKVGERKLYIDGFFVSMIRVRLLSPTLFVE